MGRGRGFGGKNSTRRNGEQDASPGMAAIENSATADFVVVDDIPGPASLGTTALSPALHADKLVVGSRAYTTLQMSSPPSDRHAYATHSLPIHSLRGAS